MLKSYIYFCDTKADAMRHYSKKTQASDFVHIFLLPQCVIILLNSFCHCSAAFSVIAQLAFSRVQPHKEEIALTFELVSGARVE